MSAKKNCGCGCMPAKKTDKQQKTKRKPKKGK